LVETRFDDRSSRSYGHLRSMPIICCKALDRRGGRLRARHEVRIVDTGMEAGADRAQAFARGCAALGLQDRAQGAALAICHTRFRVCRRSPHRSVQRAIERASSRGFAASADRDARSRRKGHASMSFGSRARIATVGPFRGGAAGLNLALSATSSVSTRPLWNSSGPGRRIAASSSRRLSRRRPGDGDEADPFEHLDRLAIDVRFTRTRRAGRARRQLRARGERRRGSRPAALCDVPWRRRARVPRNGRRRPCVSYPMVQPIVTRMSRTRSPRRDR